MSGERAANKSLQQAVESLTEDERLRSHLTDDEAAALLAWGEAQLKQATVSGRGRGAARGKAGAMVERVRATLRAANDLIGACGSLSDDDLRQQSQDLLATWDGAAATGSNVDELVRLCRAGDSQAFVHRLVAVLSSAPPTLPPPLALLVPIVLVLCMGLVLGGCTYLPPQPASPGSHPMPPLSAVTAAATTRPTATPALPTRAPTRAPSSRATATPSSTQPSSTSTWYQVFFTAPHYPDTAADHHGGLDERLAAFISRARISVDMAIYQLDLPDVTQALLAAQKRGCRVRVVTDIDILNDDQENPSFKQLQAAKITVVGGNRNAIMHDKFVVVDDAAVWTGSWNFTTNDTYRYNNNGIQIESPELAHNYTVTFEKMWRDRKFGASRQAGGTTPRLTIGGATVENYFAPEDDVTAKIAVRLEAAQKSIDFMVFSFTDDTLGKILRRKNNVGIAVQGVFETTGSETEYSEYNRLRAARVDVVQDGNPYLMHHKVFIVDGRTIIFGSFNFTGNAEKANDENLLIVDDPALAAQFTAEFARVRDEAKK